MKDIKGYFNSILESVHNSVTKDDENTNSEQNPNNPELEVEESENEPEVESEDDFRKAARAKFEAAFGDDLDEEKMNKVIDGILKDNQDLVDDGDWGALMGILNNSFSN